jgi:hypothetical protein
MVVASMSSRHGPSHESTQLGAFVAGGDQDEQAEGDAPHDPVPGVGGGMVE